MADTSSVGSLNTVSQQVQTAVQQYQSTLTSQQVTPLQNQQTSLNARLTALATMKTKLQTLYTTTTAMAVTGSSSTFLGLTASSSNPGVVTATASSGATAGNHTVLVTQLAKTDLALSDQLTSSATSIVDAEGAGTKTIQVGNVSVDVTLTAGDSDSTVLGNIADAINAKGGNVSASVVSDTSTTSRLVLQSTQTGSANAIALSDTAGTLLANLGLSSSVVSGRNAFTSTTGGYLNQDASTLDAKFKLDGIDITRSGNTVTDALTGVTLTLNGAQNASDLPATVSVGINTNQVQSTVQQFINNYNDLLQNLTSEMAVDPTTNTRQIFAGDPTFTMLKVNLQSLIYGQVSSVKSGNPANLFQLGVTAAADGTLSISDTTKFNAAMAADPTKISDLFNSSNGLAVQMNNLLKNFVAPTSGRMDSMTSIVKSETSSLSDRITTVQARISNQVTQYQNQLVQLQAALEEAQNLDSEMSYILSGDLYSTTSSGLDLTTSSS
ncbi:MAG TPA: flagellar filament capping protein FliD [Bacteroidota bacterium]|nr:flagellar filament capping protein FliD [Bacteroidota bacterium]